MVKKLLNYLNNVNSEKERQRVLDNFYTKQMKNGKTTRADILDKIALTLCALIFLIVVLNRFIGNFIISLVLASTIGIVSIVYLRKLRMKLREKKIEEIKREYKRKLEEEKVLLPDEDIEEYIISRYYEKKLELKKSINLLNKDKIFKLYLLFIVFYIISYFSAYPTYYKIMAIVSFILATIIGSYNITEYIRKKHNNDLLNRDIDI